MFIGLFGAEVSLQLGLMKKFEPLNRPLIKISHLPPEAGLGLVAGIGSTLAANSMLAGFHKDKRISDKEVILSSLLSSTPVYIKETFTYQLPVVFPVLGVFVGMAHLLIFWFSGLVKLFLIILVGRKILPARSIDSPMDCPDDKKHLSNNFKQIIKRAFKNQMKPFMKIVFIYISITFIILLLSHFGILKIIESQVTPLTSCINLPSNIVTPVATYIIHPIAGISSMGTLLRQGEITNYQTIVALLLGSLILLPVLSLRGLLPKYISLFGFRIGTIIILISTGVSVFVRGIILLILIYLGGYCG